MANTTALKRRIKSVRSTRQITKAMELVSASKMRRAQEAAGLSREYRNLAQKILSRLREQMDVNVHPLFRQRQTIASKIYILVTSDRGLVGAYNSNVFRRTTSLLREDAANGVTSQCIVIGKRGAKFLARLDGVETLAAYEHFAEQPTANDIRPILETVQSLYAAQTVDAVDLIYTDYKSSVVQEVTVQRLLPAAYTSDTTQAITETDEDDRPSLLAKVYGNKSESDGMVFEPSPAAVLDIAAERLLEVQLWQAVLESKASEFSMSMMAMKNASDNASEIIDDLTLEFNTARQAAITQELAEITGGAEAIK